MYFAWGETKGYANGDNHEFTWATYKFTTDGGSTATKYNSTDGKKVLDAEDDAATVNLGGNWRMPTDDELNALQAGCYCKWTIRLLYASKFCWHSA